ncbi:hypothetical protein BAUCODRAFT_31634 [Baudoinia panamericana UAMH 10762]|uniref:Berberine/berberine-like domain-containing protein n=1 Tax=Baudoinia panamericana (strain UAMH 10762) TaxID=717646 RepID=M2LX95_BAUPA|nr:uncharacterized protein BAUCODRAFT_31634 [Baudoinia panamericana UAMH 10762]EMC99317.1 hypothetical protein BAUCODRAFT_31634 [Baudoinia panamericana UAMH 10762]
MVGATVVLSNGDIVHASETDNDALFWGLLGAGQNFGVVTEFELRAYPQNEVYQGTLVLPPAPGVISKIIATMNDLYHVPTPGQYSKTQGRLSLLLGLARPPEAQHKTMVLLIMAYDGSGEDCKQLLQPVLDLGPVVNTLQMGPYPAVNKQVPTVSGFRSSMKGAAFVLPIRYEFFMHMLRKFDTFMDAETDAAGSLVAWEVCDPTAVVTSEKGCFANRGYHLNSLIMPLWSETESDMTCRQFARDMSLEFKKELELHGQRTSEGSEGGASVKGRRGAVLLYGNYDQYNEISRDIFGDNYPALQQLKAKYDPTNMFNKLFPITPEDVVKL